MLQNTKVVSHPGILTVQTVNWNSTSAATDDISQAHKSISREYCETNKLARNVDNQDQHKHFENKTGTKGLEGKENQ